MGAAVAVAIAGAIAGDSAARGLGGHFAGHFADDFAGQLAGRFADLAALAPLLILLAASVGVMLLAAARPGHRRAAAATALALLLALASLPLAWQAAPRAVTGLVRIDAFALFCQGLILAAALASSLFAYAYLERAALRGEEFHILLLAATLGAAALVASTHFATFFLALELTGASLFALVAYPVREQRALEAGVKYLVLSGLSSALLLFGVALIYYQSGSLHFAPTAGDAPWPLAAAGHALLLAGLGFKLSLAPFHFWAPDVYEGAPAPAAGFLATVSKGAVAALLLRYAEAAQLPASPPAAAMLETLAVLSIAVGNLLALRQENLKRLLAYSSIAHLGYLLAALVAGGPLGREAATGYLAAYVLANLGAFGVVAALSAPPRDAGSPDSYRGLFRTRPLLAAVLAAHLLSLAGMPLTVGFVGKFYLFAGGVAAARWPLVAALALGSTVGLYFYLRVVAALYASPAPQLAAPAAGAGGGALALGLLTLGLLGFGVYPEPALRLIHSTVAGY